VQLKIKQKSSVREQIAALSAGLLAVTGALGPANAQDYGTGADTFGPGTSYTQLDTAFLVYQETGGRVQAIEPSATLALHGRLGETLSLGLVADAVSGATPNGAVASNQVQTFVTPIMISGGHTTVTSASGGSTIISLPGIPSVRQYTVAPNTLPVDKGFHDHRGAFDFNWSQPLGVLSDVGFGGGYSREQDYQAITANAHIVQNFNSDNTTLSLTLDSEFDSSFPYGGVPAPLAVMSGAWKKPSSRDKTQLGFVVGLTEVITRRWLLQLDYSFDSQSGYQNDPYRIVSVVDGTTGDPTSYLYESRPRHRQSQSIFLDNKIDFDPFVTDISFRYFTDDWGINSKTAEISERINVGRSFYLEPDFRWYEQSAANFFNYYLNGSDPVPAYASADTRLAKFSSLTYGVKLGFPITPRTEIDIKGAYYEQLGNGHPADAVGQLRQQNLFGGARAAYVFFDYVWDFH